MTAERAEEADIVLAASFTIDPARETMAYLSDLLGWRGGVEIAPYAQVFQQILDPMSALRRGSNRASVLAIRLRDLIAGDQSPQDCAEELAATIASVSWPAPLLVLLCPQERPDPQIEAAQGVLAERLAGQLAGRSNVSLARAEDAFALYEVPAPFDPIADASGHVPYTEAGMAALGAQIIRWTDAATRKPLKILASDCDHTLWAGVLGEDGVDGITLSAGHLALQAALAAQAEAGRVVALLSKNEDADVLRAFDERDEFALPLSSVLARSIGWEPKPQGLAQIAARFEAGLDTVLFLDDNPVECAQMQAAHPAVTTIRVPTDPAQIARFAAHLWPLDLTGTTDEDRKRVQRYRDEAARAEERQHAGTLRDFLASLQLRIEIDAAAPADLPRLAQLSLRTTQFNAALKPMSEAELAGQISDPAALLFTVRVRDRFGDYGLVGAMRAQIEGARLSVDQFLLSCRALGRGVEHAMLRRLGEAAEQHGAEEIALEITHGPRNQPVRAFLAKVLGTAELAAELPPDLAEGTLLRPACGYRAAAFDADAPDAEDRPAPASTSGSDALTRSAAYERLSLELTSARALLAALRGSALARPALETPWRAPAPGLEAQITAIWEDVLGLTGIGAEDRFVDLGGRSIQLVRIHARIVTELGLPAALTDLFEHTSPAALARHLSRTRPQAQGAHARIHARIEERARKMLAKRLAQPVAQPGTNPLAQTAAPQGRTAKP
ncbi:MAG: HAD-IIIC family phosphatase [Neomegalonema sp.]|nr:HAD-IIIC family phosphatase [Neomegalonema sp.]